jgi:adenosylcobinamide-phosphate synthase
MGFVALILALLIEQGRPLPRDNPVYNTIRWLTSSVRSATDAGEYRYGVIGWCILVVGAAALAGFAHWLFARLHPIALFILHLAVLYWTVGFRQFSHSFSEIQKALLANDVDGAKLVLERWLQNHEPDFILVKATRSQICRLAVSNALIQAHRHVFAPLFWYILLPGPIGPIIYRIAEYLARTWSDPAEPYSKFARDAYRVLDWIPLRLSIAGFAIVGNFEDAIYCWRGASNVTTDSPQRDLLLAAGSGALGMRIADPELEAKWSSPREGEQTFEWNGAVPDTDGLRSAVGLVWRAVLLWIMVFALLTMASWLGRGGAI